MYKGVCAVSKNTKNKSTYSFTVLQIYFLASSIIEDLHSFFIYFSSAIRIFPSYIFLTSSEHEFIISSKPSLVASLPIYILDYTFLHLFSAIVHIYSNASAFTLFTPLNQPRIAFADEP